MSQASRSSGWCPTTPVHDTQHSTEKLPGSWGCWEVNMLDIACATRSEPGGFAKWSCAKSTQVFPSKSHLAASLALLAGCVGTHV